MAKNKEDKSTMVLDEKIESAKDVSSSATKFDFESFFDKNKKIVYGVTIVALLAVTGLIGYNYFVSNQDNDAQKEMFIAVAYFERDSLDQALNGDKVNRGLLEISEDYGMSKGGNLANFYIGAIYLKKGKFEEAIEYLKKFSSSDLLLQARAYRMIGDAYLEQKDLDNAIANYKKATEYKPNEFTTPNYLLKLGMAYELNKDYASAAKAYSTIVDDFSKAQEVNDAKKYKARAEAMIQE